MSLLYIVDLEAFATSVAAFFGEDASTIGAAAHARDRSVIAVGGGEGVSGG